MAKKKKEYKCFKWFLKGIYKKPKFKYLDNASEINEPCVILSNHVGSQAPVKLQLHFKQKFRMWGTYEMNTGLKGVYKYLSEIYYPQKKHWPKWIAKVFCLVAAPIVDTFYKSANIISTYRDSRLRKTMQESVDAIESSNSLIIFPEDSSRGYFDKIENFFAGFVLVLERCFKRGIDVPIRTMYFQKKKNTFVVSEAVKYSTLVSQNLNRYQITELFREKCNTLAQI